MNHFRDGDIRHECSAALLQRQLHSLSEHAYRSLYMSVLPLVEQSGRGCVFPNMGRPPAIHQQTDHECARSAVWRDEKARDAASLKRTMRLGTIQQSQPERAR